MTLASRAGAFLALLFMGQVKPRQGRSHCKEAESGENTPASPRASQGWTTGLWSPLPSRELPSL